ncbi:MAG TPA: VOC family protein [Aggregatilineales bacterium]|nr:VOC family protein [Anaerolineales bacterium]HRE47967.1 VOC family protein [Aggregatilineales bacterium]
MTKIVPHLWFDKQAKEAAECYAAVFDDSRVLSAATLSDTPSGNIEIVNVVLCGQPFQFLSAGPLFQFNPSISFQVDCATSEECQRLWSALVEGGAVLMPLGVYPFSEQYGWLQDRYGVSWQIALIAGAKQRITPTLMFTGAQHGKAKEAIDVYTGLFPNATLLSSVYYGKDADAPAVEGTVKHATFTLDGLSFAAIDSAHDHGFSFNESISFMVYCQTQAEIDHYWNALSAVPEAEQCGWLKDAYGVSWQIVPEAMDAMMSDPDSAAVARVTEAFLAMKKFDLAALEKAYTGG